MNEKDSVTKAKKGANRTGNRPARGWPHKAAGIKIRLKIQGDDKCRQMV